MNAKSAYRRFVDFVLGPEPGTPEHWKWREALGLNGKQDWKCEDCGFVTTQVIADMKNLPDKPNCGACGSWDVEGSDPVPTVQYVDLEDRWYFRYPCAALFLWYAWHLLSNPVVRSGEAPKGVWVSIGSVILAACLARELSMWLLKWLFIWGGIAAVMYGLSSLPPTSQAIIVGAIIIGWCIWANGSRR
jgi:hypothetical protein